MSHEIGQSRASIPPRQNPGILPSAIPSAISHSVSAPPPAARLSRDAPPRSLDAPPHCPCVAPLVGLFDSAHCPLPPFFSLARLSCAIGQLFPYAILGFAFAEATGLLALMMAFILLYVA
ncbi:uncharacterized protein K441DRAFT_617094 [Cenococcum geophilum 1.58]|uniref:uncharacterized protein n=1 Tax=Cenococcum geophilum 1.58 TaxID=794803 RepID=UPI00358E8810|nr:hypothetical protein K441DRAFT_617094 [Cenococcum geophilum 1.58]